MPITAVTGAASGIGKTVCETLKAAGHRIIGIDRNNADINADLSTAEGRESAVADTLEQCQGRLDGLVCCAGVGVTFPSDMIVGVNYFGVTKLLEGLQDALQQGEQPAVLVIGSVAGNQMVGRPHEMVSAMLDDDETAARRIALDLAEPHTAYAASKYAVSSYVRQQAPAWGKQGLRANVIAPGAVETPLHQAAKDDPRFGEAVKNFVAPLGRAGTPQEIANVVAFLQSDQASFIHGSVFFVDGGMDAMVRPGQF
nr:SDR family oxidoreductase [uncultured Halomonas sp.]